VDFVVTPEFTRKLLGQTFKASLLPERTRKGFHGKHNEANFFFSATNDKLYIVNIDGNEVAVLFALLGVQKIPIFNLHGQLATAVLDLGQ
jgi:hypothetical protein